MQVLECIVGGGDPGDAAAGSGAAPLLEVSLDRAREAAGWTALAEQQELSEDEVLHGEERDDES
eukprot:6381924-Prymnesium_polylepis.1